VCRQYGRTLKDSNNMYLQNICSFLKRELQIKVFIQNEAGSRTKNRHDEKTLEHIGSSTLSQPYPYPYGFVLETTTDDGDNADCYVITKSKLTSGTTVECCPVGLLEQFESGENDHKVLAVIPGENIDLDDSIREELRVFIETVTAHFPSGSFIVGRLLPRKSALDFIEASRDKENSISA